MTAAAALLTLLNQERRRHTGPAGVSPSFSRRKGSGRPVLRPLTGYPRSRSMPGSNSGSAVTVAAMRLPKYSISTESPSETAAGSQA